MIDENVVHDEIQIRVFDLSDPQNEGEVDTRPKLESVSVEYDLPFHAIGWRVIIKPNKAETKSAGGIELPPEILDIQDANQYLAIVVSVGPLAYKDQAKFQPIDGKVFKPFCKVGDVVAFNKYGGQKLILANGEEYRILNDEDILAVIDDPDAMITPY